MGLYLEGLAERIFVSEILSGLFSVKGSLLSELSRCKRSYQLWLMLSFLTKVFYIQYNGVIIKTRIN